MICKQRSLESDVCALIPPYLRGRQTLSCASTLSASEKSIVLTLYNADLPA